MGYKATGYIAREYKVPSRSLLEVSGLSFWYDYKFIQELFGTSPETVKKLNDLSGDPANTLSPVGGLSANALKIDGNGLYKEAADTTRALRGSIINPFLNFLHTGVPFFILAVCKVDYTNQSITMTLVDTKSTSSSNGIEIILLTSNAPNSSPRIRIRLFNAGTQVVNITGTSNVMPVGSYFIVGIKFYGTLKASSNVSIKYGAVSGLLGTAASSGYSSANHNRNMNIIGNSTPATRFDLRHLSAYNCSDILTDTAFDLRFAQAIELLKLDTDYTSLTSPI